MDSQVVDIVKPLVIGITLVGLFVIVPVVAILTEHQRKMAKILRPQPDDALREEVRELRNELRMARGESDMLPPIERRLNEEDDDNASSQMVVGFIGQKRKPTRDY